MRADRTFLHIHDYTPASFYTDSIKPNIKKMLMNDLELDCCLSFGAIQDLPRTYMRRAGEAIYASDAKIGATP